MPDDLHKALAAIKNHVTNAERSGVWPLSEPDTERLVVEPILTALGYSPLDYRKRTAGAGGDFPDYIVLPKYDQKWILEAKEWDHRLDMRAARQAVNYARNNGARWAVLTNGREWQLHNTEARSGLEEGPAYRAVDIIERQAEASTVLSRLAREDVLGGTLDEDLRSREIITALREILADPPARVLRALVEAVRGHLDRNITREDVLRAVQRAIEGIPGRAAPAPVGESPAPAAPRGAGTLDQRVYPLSELARHGSLATGASPIEVRLPGGVVVGVDSWAALSVHVTRWACTKSGIPDLPFRSGPRTTKNFLNAEPVHPDGSTMRATKEIVVADTRVWLDVHRSARNICRSLVALCADRSVDPASVKVQLEGHEE